MLTNVINCSLRKKFWGRRFSSPIVEYGREAWIFRSKTRFHSAAWCNGRIRLHGLNSPCDLSADTRRGSSYEIFQVSLWRYVWRASCTACVLKVSMSKICRIQMMHLTDFVCNLTERFEYFVSNTFSFYWLMWPFNGLWITIYRNRYCLEQISKTINANVTVTA